MDQIRASAARIAKCLENWFLVVISTQQACQVARRKTRGAFCVLEALSTLQMRTMALLTRE